MLNIREADGVAHLIQKCRDDSSMSYDACAIYLKECAALIDKTNRAKPPSKIMHAAGGSTYQHMHEPTMSLEEVSQLFHTMSKESGLKSTYQAFQSKAL